MRGPVLGFTGFVRDWHGLATVATILAGAHVAEAHLCVVGEDRGPPGYAAPRPTEQGRAAACISPVHSARADPSLLPAFDVEPGAGDQSLRVAAQAARVHGREPGDRRARSAEPPRGAAHGENALLVRPGDGAALAAALAELVREPALARRLGTAARATIVARDLTWGEMSAAFCAPVEALR